MDPDQWQRITALFAAAIDLSPQDRASFLSAHELDPAVRTRLGAMIAADSKPAPVLSVTAEELLRHGHAGSRDDTPEDQYVPPPPSTEKPP